VNFRSIHVRLIAWYTALIIVTSVAFAGYTYYSARHRLYSNLTDVLSRRIERVRDNVLPKDLPPQQLAKEIRDVYFPEASNRYIRISHTDGKVIYASGQPQDDVFNIAEIPPPKDYTEIPTRRVDNMNKEFSLLLVGQKVKAGKDEYFIEMGASTQYIANSLDKLVYTLLLGLPIVGIIALVGGFWLVQRAMEPVETIRCTAKKITFSNLRQRLPVAPTGDAIESLSITLNQMLERLEHAYQQASRFSGDASHELRTPLTIMRSELESLCASMRAYQLPMEFRERIGSVLEEAERLSNIVEGLFAVARLDAGEAKIEHKTFDLAALVQSTIEQVQLLADEKRLSVYIDAPQPVLIMGDPARLKQVVVNLLDNAIKYTMAGGTISFTVKTEPTKAILSVKDNGIGISADALPNIFDRFYRADKVRSRSTDGAGLGLSIVRSICLAHGGKINVSSKEGIGTLFTIELPLPEATASDVKLDAAA
jgi:heavy metal sensor kinase